MSDELKVTKAAVLEAASKCSTAKATLQVLFPDAFKPSDEPFDFGGGSVVKAEWGGKSPLFIARDSAPPSLEQKCLGLNPGWEVRRQEYQGSTILTFHRKP